jgi:hypothetical protein
VDKGVDAGGGRDGTRQSDGQFGIQNDDARHHLWVKNDFLLMRFLVEDDAGPADLGAGARGRRDCHDGSDAGGVSAGPPVADILEVPQRAGLSRHEGHDFAGVERRSAAESHDSVVTSGAVGAKACLDMAGGGVAADRAEQRGSAECGEGIFDHGRVDQSFIGHDQRVLHADLRAGFAELGDSSGAGPDGGGVIPIAAK